MRNIVKHAWTTTLFRVGMSISLFVYGGCIYGQSTQETEQ